jgi:hypothetical protein
VGLEVFFLTEWDLKLELATVADPRLKSTYDEAVTIGARA